MGLLALVFALVFVALMAQKVLKQYVLSPESGAHTEAGARVDRFGVGPAPVDPGGATPSTENPMDRVRRLGDAVRERAGSLE